MNVRNLGWVLFLIAGQSWADDSKIAAGGAHSCAVEGDASVWCWGANQWGQLGSPGGNPNPSPIQMASSFGGANVTTVVAGNDHTCALTSAGEIWCWGRNQSGQLGTATPGNAPSATPLKVAGLNSATELSAGADHTCAIRSDQMVVCWGSNTTGQLGRSTVGTSDPVPGIVTGVTQVVAMSAGDRHSCAVRSMGQVLCWGDNFDGQLGRGTFSDPQVSAAPVIGIGDAVEVAAGGAFSCARNGNGDVACWGANAAGQLGVGAAGVSVAAPQVLAGLSDAVQIDAGHLHMCAQRETGILACWGSSDAGQVGTGDWEWSVPSPLVVGSGIADLSAGLGHTCVRRSSSTLACWGDNSNGQLGNGELSLDTAAPKFTGLVSVAALTAGAYHTCASNQDGAVSCWGKNQYGELGVGVAGGARVTPQLVVGLEGALEIAAGYSHTCAIRNSGTVACWGYNYYQQLGTDSGGQALATPTDVEDLGNAVALSGGGRHTCAAKADGSVWCWGDNLYSQLGADTAGWPSAQPLQVPGLTGVLSITAGNYHTCVLRQGGSIWCWGRNGDGQLGNGTVGGPVMVPQQVNALPGSASKVLAGANHTCAQISNAGAQQVWCWGAGGLGQLGNGPNPEPQPHPLQVGTTMALMSADAYSTCGQSMQGAVLCWGNNGSGQLSTGGYGTLTLPTISLGFVDASEIVIGDRHACGLLWDTAHVFCAGNSFFGQRGDGTISSSPVPVTVEGLGDDGIFADDFEL